MVRDFNFDGILNNISYGFAFLNQNFSQVTEIRKALDAYFIEAAIVNLTSEDIDELSAIIARMEQRTAHREDLSQEDYAFHALLYARANNPLAEQLFEIHWAIRMNTYQKPRLQELLPGAVTKHQVILDVIKRRYVAEARRLLLEHHQSIEEWFYQQGASGSSRD